MHYQHLKQFLHPFQPFLIPITFQLLKEAVLLPWFILLIGRETKLIGVGIHSSYFYYCVLRVFYNICNEP